LKIFHASIFLIIIFFIAGFSSLHVANAQGVATSGGVDVLNEKQNDTFQKELVKSWGFPQEDD